MFSAMKYTTGCLSLIDQRLLPQEEVWVECRDLEAVARGIEDMVTRGAPAIGCSAAFALAIDAHLAAKSRKTWSDYQSEFATAVERLHRTRPTAVNLFYALDKMKQLAAGFAATTPMADVDARVSALAQHLYDDDLATCKAIGEHGAAMAEGRKIRVLTHCNTGSLATAGYGTALGVIRSLAKKGQIEIVYADETRPYLQGSRLTAFELKSEGINHKVIADSAAAYLMQQSKVDWVIVGADRIALNGDTANKIGTYSLAVNCRHHGVKFFVAAPVSTIDFSIESGAQIPVEERSPEEIRVTGSRQMTPKDAPVYNPSFDVTPSDLISGIITEKGVLRPPYREAMLNLKKSLS
jgi:methylthioribose-1-phosphate isomerase